MKKIENASQLDAYRNQCAAERDPDRAMIAVCTGTGCQAHGCDKVVDLLRSELKSAGFGGKVEVKTTGCHGYCEKGPLAVVRPEGILYQRVKEKNIADIVSKTIAKGEVLDKLLFFDPATKKRVKLEKDVPFYKLQERLVFGDNGYIDPTSIEDYLGIGGYKALQKALTEMDPDKVLAEVKEAGLRGRGGGGFAAGRKWDSAKKVAGDVKYVICNGVVLLFVKIYSCFNIIKYLQSTKCVITAPIVSDSVLRLVVYVSANNNITIRIIQQSYTRTISWCQSRIVVKMNAIKCIVV